MPDRFREAIQQRDDAEEEAEFEHAQREKAEARLREVEEKLARLRAVLRFERVTKTETDEWSYVRDTVVLSSGEGYRVTSSVVLDGEAAEALKAALAASPGGGEE